MFLGSASDRTAYGESDEELLGGFSARCGQKNHLDLKVRFYGGEVVIAVWLVAGAAGVASVRPTIEPAGAVAAGPYSDVTQVVIMRQGKVAAIDDEEDGDDDQNDPDDPNDTLAAADAFWWGTADATLRASWTERERQPRSEALAKQVDRQHNKCPKGLPRCERFL